MERRYHGKYSGPQASRHERDNSDGSCDGQTIVINPEMLSDGAEKAFTYISESEVEADHRPLTSYPTSDVPFASFALKVAMCGKQTIVGHENDAHQNVAHYRLQGAPLTSAMIRHSIASRQRCRFWQAGHGGRFSFVRWLVISTAVYQRLI
jgi:hypothetical protein